VRGIVEELGGMRGGIEGGGDGAAAGVSESVMDGPGVGANVIGARGLILGGHKPRPARGQPHQGLVVLPVVRC
jgi:hypothetical protein